MGALNIPCRWIDPRRARIAREITEYGYLGYFPGPVDFLGAHAKGGHEASLFLSTFVGLQGDQGLLLTHYLINLADLGFPPFKPSRMADSSLYGDVLAACWNLYSRERFDLRRFFGSLQISEPHKR